MRGTNVDEPDDYERRAIDRHPLTQRLNRELLKSFRRNSRLDAEAQGVNNQDMKNSEGKHEKCRLAL
jgi:hypothetical protein